MKELRFVIPGNPLAKKRPRFARRGKFVTTYNAQETEEGKFIQVMMSQIHGHNPIPAGTPILMQCAFNMPVPLSMPKKYHGIMRHTKKPDLDNLIKFIKDCANGILWHDDSQVIKIEAVKRYAYGAAIPSTEIFISWEL
jgi:Holliday junction resolvase RusA-like endonuclease